MDKNKFYRLINNQLHLQEKEIKPEALLVDDLGADSFDITELVHVIEVEYGIEIKSSDLPNLQKVKDLEIYVQKRIHA